MQLFMDTDGIHYNYEVAHVAKIILTF